MKCVLIFDGLNDVIFSKYDKEFSNHINTYAKAQGLVPEHCKDEEISSNVIVQIFSPLVTSHRIMNCEFGNTYDVIECENGINLVFNEYMGHLIVTIGKHDSLYLKLLQRTCISIIRSICSVNIQILRNDAYLKSMVCCMLDSWEKLYNLDQSVRIEAVEQLIVNSDLTSVALEALREAIIKIKFPKVHGLIMVQNKFLSLYSSQNAKELSSSDIILLTILNNIDRVRLTESNFDSNSDISSNLYYSSLNDSSMYQSLETDVEDMDSYFLYLAGYEADPSCVPHVIHIVPVADDINLFVILEMSANAQISIRVYETFLHLHVLQNLQIQRDAEKIKQALHNLETAVNKLSDGLRNLKAERVEVNYKVISLKWKQVKTLYQELVKNVSDAVLLKAESSLSGLVEALKKLFDLCSCDVSFLNGTKKVVKSTAGTVVRKLAGFSDMFKVKAMKNFSLGSYLEEFPGLVHFIYVDRTSHRVVAPTLDISARDDANNDFRAEIWRMIEFSHRHLRDGHLSFVWKDSTFIFAYFLWFESSTGTSIKPTVSPSQAIKRIPQLGILNSDFYYKLKQHCFPKLSPNKVRCYELYSVHLKIAAPALVFDHMKRLTATVWEIKGHPGHPIDLL